MKNKFFYFLMCLGMVLGTSTFVSCGDDDDELPVNIGGNNGGAAQQTPQSLVGHKLYVDMKYPDGINGKPASYQFAVTFKKQQLVQRGYNEPLLRLRWPPCG